MPRPGRTVQIGRRMAEAAPAGAPDPTARCASASFGGAWKPFRTGCSRQRSVCPKRTRRLPPPPVYAEVPPPRGVRPRAARPGTDAARSQLSGTGRANMAEILAGRGADAPTARSPSQDNRSREERLSVAPCRFRPAVFRAAFRRIRRQNPGTALSCPSPPRSDRGGRRIPSARTGSGSTV